MSTTTEKCQNVTPVSRFDEKGNLRRNSVCGECGGYLAVLASGVFRKHNPVMKPGNPQIEINIAGMKPFVAANGNRFTPEQAKLITEPLTLDPVARY